MKIGIIASELYDGGEITWTKTLLKALMKIEFIERLNLYVNKDFEHFHKYFYNEKKVKIHKVKWGFRFSINKNPNIYKKIIRLLTITNNPLAYFLFGLNILNKDNDLIISPYVSTESKFTDKPLLMCPQDTRHLYKKLELNSFIKKLKYFLAEKSYIKTLQKASIIIVEANYIKEDIINYYKINYEKIKICVTPPDYEMFTQICNSRFEQIQQKYNLYPNFLFYPAHFIEDKNHINLLRAIKLIKDKYGELINLVLVGSKKNNFENVMSEIKNLSLQNQVKYLGYVPDEDMPYLYKLSTALVMPTLFESVSLPIWEAFYLGAPVVSSNICALPEQVGDAGLVFNPNNIEDMAEKIYKIWNDESLRKELVNRGYERIKNLTLENYSKQWEEIIREAIRNE